MLFYLVLPITDAIQLALAPTLPAGKTLNVHLTGEVMYVISKFSHAAKFTAGMCLALA
jgi:hypothetical protein